MKKVWIVYENCGSGHRMAAEAIYRRLQEEKDIDVSFLDLGSFSAFPGFYEKGYRLIVTKFPFVWRFLYNIYAHKFFGQVVTFFNRLSFKRFFLRLGKERPQVVISTHFFASSLISYYKSKAKNHALYLFTVVTDFGVYPLWVNKLTDYYFVASEDTRRQMVKSYKIEAERIIVSGIPVREQFFQPLARSEILKKYGVPENTFCVFIFSSDMGIGPIEKVILELRNEAAILVSYGKNLQLKEHLERLIPQCLYLKVFGRIDAIWEVMDIADVVITKAGGISVSECLVKQKPMIFIYAFYGQEEQNVEFVLRHKAGFRPHSPDELVDLIKRLRRKKEEFLQLKKQIESINYPNAAAVIAAILAKL